MRLETSPEDALVSSRVQEKQRRRAEREAREREAATRERRARRMRLVGVPIIGAVAVAGVAAQASTGGGGGELPAGSGAAFGQHYNGLEQRRVAANVSTMSAPSASTHTHPKVSVWADGRAVPVPANIGIDPRRPPGDMASLHTHDTSGTIHNEGQANATLGQFFAVWGVPFGRDRLGPYRAGEGKTVQMWVDGKPSTAFGSLKLADGQDITVTFGPRRSAPPAGS
jgi:hypothetical protein